MQNIIKYAYGAYMGGIVTCTVIGGVMGGAYGLEEKHISATFGSMMMGSVVGCVCGIFLPVIIPVAIVNHLGC